MEVEVEGEDGSKFVLGKGKALFGRGSGFNTNDRTVSRRHVMFQQRSSLEQRDAGAEPRVSFEVIGRNPIWVFNKKDGAIRVFRKFEKGELEVGDRFCLSGKAPLWFNLKDSEVQEGKTRVLESDDEVAEGSHNGIDIEDIDVSGIDPVKEFGFVVMGHEFDYYPKGMIRNVKNWDWFLEEPRKDSEDEDDFEEKRTIMRRKRKKLEENGDDDWTVESEEDKDLVAKNIRKVKRSGYSTRSKHQNSQTKDTNGSKTSGRKKATVVNVIDEDEEDEDETLGGFIVDDEEEDWEEKSSEEEDFEEEEDDDEVED